jgi:spheroidene monooxygenase
MNPNGWAAIAAGGSGPQPRPTRLQPAPTLHRAADDGSSAGAAGHMRPARGGGAAADEAARAAPGLAVVLLARFPRRHVPWAVAQLVNGPAAWRGEPGLRFARVLGSGQGGGFGLRPGLDHQGLFLMFDDVADALACLSRSPRIAAYRARAEGCLVAVLQASSARGRWAGQAMQAVVPAPGPGEPVVALTRASIRTTQALRFWRHSPPSEAALAAAPGCQLAVGLGEAPVLRQATLSLWDDTAAMNAFARQGAHQQAIAASQREGYFTEWMFVRFVPLLMQGHWGGRCFDLARPEAAGHG